MARALPKKRLVERRLGDGAPHDGAGAAEGWESDWVSLLPLAGGLTCDTQTRDPPAVYIGLIELYYSSITAAGFC